MAKSTRNDPSSLLTIVDRALAHAQQEEAGISPRGGGVRGGGVRAVPDGALPPTSVPAHGRGPSTDELFGQLGDLGATVSMEIARVRAWLQARPALLRLLDDALHQEFGAMEQRLKRNALVQNIVFMVAGALLGAVVGLALPGLISTIHPTALFPGH
jgi:hypothetical protein